MTTPQAFLLGVATYHFGRPLVLQLVGHYLAWRWERRLHAAEARFRGCEHADTFLIDTGSGIDGGPVYLVPKCRMCWALKVHTGLPPSDWNRELPPEPQWTPNCAPPASYVAAADGSYWKTKGSA